MRTLLTIASLIALTTVAYCQETEIRKVGVFKGVKVSEGIDAYLKKGSKEEVKVEASGIKLSNVLTEVAGEYLRIHLKEGSYRDRDVKVYVTYVAVDKLSASSGANVFHEGVLKADELELGASSAGNIELKIDCNELEASASSAGEIEVEGKARVVDMDASSAGEVDGYDLVTESASAEASSGGSVKLSVSKSLDARASSGGSIRYRGNPERSNTNASSGGSVRKSN
jgi:hypothetical protein